MVNLEIEILNRKSLIKMAVIRYLNRQYSFWVEDAVQEVIFKALVQASKYNRSLGTLDAWLYTLTKNYCLDFIDKKSNNINWTIRTDRTYESESLSVNEANLPLEIRSFLRIELIKLSDFDREILMLKYYYAYSGHELAAYFQIPVDQIPVYVQRAKRKLKEKILKNPGLLELLNKRFKR